MPYSTARRDKLEVRPVSEARSWRPLFARPHYVRRVAGNGEPLWHTEGYSSRSNAVRSASVHGERDGLWVHIYGVDGRILRMIEPTRWDRDR
jgi:hypothetical protein